MINTLFAYESESPETATAFLEIQKTKKTLDDLELKLKSYRKEKSNQNQNTSNNPSLFFSKMKEFEPLQSPYPDLQHYLSSLLLQSDPLAQSEKSSPGIIKSQQKSRNNCLSSSPDMHPSYYSKTITENQEINKIRKSLEIEQPPNYLSLQKHTQQQLQKSQVAHLQKMYEHYQKSCEQMENKISALEKQKTKLKQDKLLLMRDNEELESRIEKKRKQKQNTDSNTEQQSPGSFLLTELNAVLSKLSKKLAKIELENNRIGQRKKNLEMNMRMCLKNSQDQLRQDLIEQSRKQFSKPKVHSIKNSKSRSHLTKSMATYSGVNHSNRCPYH